MSFTGSRGAMDSAPDFESGGCGFESRRECFFGIFGSVLGSPPLQNLGGSFVNASIAQLAEHLPRKQKVTSSILVGGWQWAVGLEV